MNEVPEKFHSELGASIASRWMSCPGSVRLARSLPTPPTTEYALEGTRAHALAELCLRKGVEPATFVGVELEGGVVTDDMAEAVKVFTDHCGGLANENSQSWVEQRFNLASLTPPGPMFGTADFVNYDRRLCVLTVVDLKYGQGVVVEAIGNKQLRYYALGALLALPKGTAVDEIDMAIVQPRALHPDGPVRSETIAVEDLLAFAAELMEAARATTAADAPLVAGSWCKFCPASGVCPAQRKRAEGVAMVEFSDLALGAAPQDPATLTPTQLGNLLTLLPLVEDWAASVRAHAMGSFERGEDVPGMKLVQKRATRRWTDAEHVEVFLRNVRVGDDFMTAPELKSPAQIEKLIGKRDFGAVADWVTKVSSGYKMVPEHHPGAAVILTAGAEFPLLPAGNSQDAQGAQGDA